MGDTPTTRPAVESDAQAMLDLYSALDSETEFMFFAPTERKTTLDQQKARIRAGLTSEMSVLFVADGSDELAGFVGGYSSMGVRNQHVLTVVVGVRESYWGRGVGKGLMHAVECWALSKSKTKLELTVMCENARAIALYSSLGFESEGLRRQSVQLDGRSLDEHHMGKLL